MNYKIVFVLIVMPYILRTVFFSYGAFLSRKKSRLKASLAENLPKVSIIVPARDEENNIESCINSIIQSNYPIEKYEIIAVNDRSNDSTLQVLNKLQQQFSNLKIINIASDSEKKVLGKPGAIDFGIKNTENDFILMTDADCKVNQNWLNEMASHLHEGNDMIASYTLVKGHKFFDRFQELEWIYSHTMAAGGLTLNNPLGCYGNNLAIKKSMYEKVGGYENIKFSVTEDLALLQAVYKKDGKIKYICNKEGLVKTNPCQSWSEYFSQKRRWVKGGQDLGYRAVAFVLTSMSIWIAIIFSLIKLDYTYAIIALIAKLLCDVFLLIPSLVQLGEAKLIKWLIPSAIFFTFLEITLPFLLINKKIKWKGQIFE